MIANIEAQSNRVYERERAAAHLDFHEALQGLGKLTVARAICRLPMPATPACAGHTSESFQAPASLFERILLALFERRARAFQHSLIAANIPASEAILLLANNYEETFHEIYVARTNEFAQQAGFYADKEIPPIYLDLIGYNARTATSKLFSQLEREILDRAMTFGERGVNDGEPTLACFAEAPPLFSVSERGPTLSPPVTRADEGTPEKASTSVSDAHAIALAVPSKPADVIESEPSNEPDLPAKQPRHLRKRAEPHPNPESLFGTRARQTFAIATQATGVRRRRVHDLIEEGKLDATGKGSARRITTASLRAYLGLTPK